MITEHTRLDAWMAFREKMMNGSEQVEIEITERWHRNMFRRMLKKHGFTYKTNGDRTEIFNQTNR